MMTPAGTAVEGERAMATLIPLRDHVLQAGQAHREEVDLQIAPYRQAGFDYVPANGHSAPAVVDLIAMNSGFDLRLRLQTDLHGPCARCLENAVIPVYVDVHEIHDPAERDPELQSEHVSADDVLDVSDWAAESIGLEFPTRPLCTDDCAGLCAMCGTNLNTGSCACEPEVGDPRWSRLKDISFRNQD